MREITTRCPGCGRKRYMRVDAWSGVTDAEIRSGEDLCRRCRRGDAPALGPLLLGAGLVVAPLAGVAAALLR